MKIIAIQGNKDVGKDSVGLMIQYLLSTPSILHSYTFYKHKKYLFYKNKVNIEKYANNIKRILGILLNVNPELFEDRKIKEEFCIDFNTLKLVPNTYMSPNKLLSDSKFNRELKKNNCNITFDYYLTVRQTLQYFGTEIMRKYFGEKIWINSTIASDCIITDQRFINEYENVKNKNGIIIHVIRPDRICGSHASEAELTILFDNNKFNILIDNNGSLEELFNKVKNVYNQYNLKTYYYGISH